MVEQTLRAAYNAPNGQREFMHTIAVPVSTDGRSKQDYLSQLRTTARKLQEEVNTFLTSKMDEDKQNVETSRMKNQAGIAEDEEEEANYGEEKIEDE